MMSEIRILFKDFLKVFAIIFLKRKLLKGWGIKFHRTAKNNNEDMFYTECACAFCFKHKKINATGKKKKERTPPSI